jgi:hypothetical protein
MFQASIQKYTYSYKDIVVGITGNIPKNWDVKDRLKT